MSYQDQDISLLLAKLLEQKEQYAKLLNEAEAKAAAAVEEAKREAAAKQEALEAALAAAAAKEEELSRFKAKTYDEVSKQDYIYISKEAAELHSDRHKIGRTIDVKKREAQHNTPSAQGVKMIYSRPTFNAGLVECIVGAVMQRYRIVREHYMCRTDHSVNVLDIACTVIDTLASSYEHITREELYNHVIGKLKDQIIQPMNVTGPLPDESVSQNTHIITQTNAPPQPPNPADWLEKTAEVTGDKSDIILMKELLQIYITDTKHQMKKADFHEVVRDYFAAHRDTGVLVKETHSIRVSLNQYHPVRNVVLGVRYRERGVACPEGGVHGSVQMYNV